MTITREQIEYQIWAWKVVERLLVACESADKKQISDAMAALIVHDATKINLTKFREAFRPLCDLALRGLETQRRPIEIAPKDGTPCLVHLPGFDPAIARYESEIGCGPPPKP